MNGFKQAQAEYESKMFNPYDYENECDYEHWLDLETDRRIEERLLSKND